ncbi:MAG: HAMP domain-containing histidine kinase [Candidatus Zixiibacteriota bacterium]|nr:MAG: HAMP domain-containing histidine kinase [candidate division Zixibacteria bacterium]
MLAGSKRLFVLVLFIIAVIALVNVVWWLYYERTASLLEYQLGRRLSAVARSGGVALHPELIDSLTVGDIEAYLEVTGIIEEIRSADSLSEVFVVDEGYRVLASTSLDADSTYFLAELNGRYIDSVYYSLMDITVTTPTYRTGSVYLKSAFSPLVDSDGFIVAVLGVEADVDYFDVLTDLRVNIVYSTVFSVVGGLIIGLVFLVFQRRINRAEQQLYLNQTHSYLGRMVAVVSHEIRNPLMIIRASAERLLGKLPGDESRFIVEEVDRLNRIVSGYLDFAGAKERLVGHDPVETVQLAQLVGNIRKHLQSKYPEEELVWTEADVDSSLSFETHPRSLRQVILNLLINGADACREASKPIRIGVAAAVKNGRVIIRVIDEGPGMTGKDIKKIFAPFYTTKQAGSGLGLYLTKKIVEEMGGKIHIESRQNERTEVIIDLPAAIDR